MEKVDQNRVARAARLYASNKEAGQALGIAAGSFGRLCRQYGIPTPQARRQRRWQAQRQSQESLTE
jgi:hypothetical protein